VLRREGSPEHSVLHPSMRFRIMRRLRGAMWTGEHRGRSAALQYPVNALAVGADLLSKATDRDALEGWMARRSAEANLLRPPLSLKAALLDHLIRPREARRRDRLRSRYLAVCARRTDG
jgi:hypothetical protein